MAQASVSWAQVLAWRLRRQYLEPRTGAGVVEIVRRLCGVQAQVASCATQAVVARQARPAPGAVERALTERALVKTWAMRGTLHLLPPEVAGAFGRLLAHSRPWERPVWEKYFGLSPSDMRDLAERAPGVLDGVTLTHDELISAIAAGTAYGERLRSGWGTALKPLAWQGLLCHGPSQGSRVTFTSPATWAPGWRAYPDVAEAARVVIPAYLGAYGPATPDRFRRWLRLDHVTAKRWFAELRDLLVPVDVEGTPTWLPAEHLDELLATRPSRAVRLLPPFDQYLLGPGTDDPQVLAPQWRTTVSKTAGWLAPIVVAKGRVAGVWSGGYGAPVEVTEFGPVDAKALATEVRRVA